MDYYNRKESGAKYHALKKKNAGKNTSQSHYDRYYSNHGYNKNGKKRTLVRSLFSNKNIDPSLAQECCPTNVNNKTEWYRQTVSSYKPRYLGDNITKKKKVKWWDRRHRTVRNVVPKQLNIQLLSDEDMIIVGKWISDAYENPSSLFYETGVFEMIKYLYDIEWYVYGYDDVVNYKNLRNFLYYRKLSNARMEFFWTFGRKKKSEKKNDFAVYDVGVKIVSYNGNVLSIMPLYRFYAFPEIIKDVNYYYVTPTYSICKMRGYYLQMIKDRTNTESDTDVDTTIGKGLFYSGNYSIDKNEVNEDDDEMDYDSAKIIRKHITSLFG